MNKRSIAMGLSLAFFVSTAWNPAPVEAKQVSLQLSHTKKALKVGQSFALKVTKGSKKVTWSVTKKGVVSLSKKKAKSVLVKGKKAGTTVVVATYAKQKAKCRITVSTKKKDSTQVPSIEPTATIIASPTGNPTVEPMATVEPTPTPNPTAVPTDEANLTYSGGVTNEMCKASYWIKKSKTPDQLLISSEQIQKLNQAMLKNDGTNMHDLENMKETYNGISLRNSLASEGTPEKNYYLDGAALADKENYFEQMRKNIRDAQATETDQIRYALCVKRAEMHSWPTKDCLGYSATDADDELLSSVLIVNEPFVVKTITSDGKFCFGYSSNCTGWVETERLAFCEDKTEWLDAWQNERFLVVTEDKIVMEKSNLQPDTSELQLSLSTRLNLVPKDQIPKNISERGTWNNYVVYVPTRDKDGKYVKKVGLISQHYNVSIGYLPATERNILNVAFECLGNRYGWGGMLDAMDCSMYTRSIYRCLGIELPRNTTWQCEIPTKNVDVSSASLQEKQVALDELPAGTLLFFPGHIMMYVGKAEGTHYVISATGSLCDVGESDVRSMYSVILNTVDVRRKNGKTWLENITKYICPWRYPVE